MMTKEEWEEACGYFDKEEYLVAAIKKHLLTEDQKQILFNMNLSVEDLLNGRYPIGQGELIQHIFYDVWNEKLGWKDFGC